MASPEDVIKALEDADLAAEFYHRLIEKGVLPKMAADMTSSYLHARMAMASAEKIERERPTDTA